jgi:hypothetical protein
VAIMMQATVMQAKVALPGGIEPPFQP